jgi:hypothetical protein
MARVFLKRKDSFYDNSGLNSDVDTGGNSADHETGPNNDHFSSSDNLAIEIEDKTVHCPTLPSTEEKEESIRCSETEPVAEPSWMPDVPYDDVRDL